MDGVCTSGSGFTLITDRSCITPKPDRSFNNTVRSKMKSLIIAIMAQMMFAACVIAGRPIILTEAEACSGADLVVIGKVSKAKDVPADADDPFAWSSSWHNFGFTKVAPVKVEDALLGTAPDVLRIYGGKLGAGTDFRIEEGRYLLLLTRVKDDAHSRQLSAVSG